MFNCFKCPEGFSSIPLLCKHIKYLHGWHPGEVLVCNQNDCYQKFAHLDRFKRHLEHSHRNQISNTTTRFALPNNNENKINTTTGKLLYIIF